MIGITQWRHQPQPHHLKSKNGMRPGNTKGPQQWTLLPLFLRKQNKQAESDALRGKLLIGTHFA